MFTVQEIEQLPPSAAVLVEHPIAQVGPVEAGHVHPRPAQGQAAGDFGPRRGIGGGGEGDPRHPGEAFGEDREAQIFGTEVMPPLRDAMRLVDREECQRRAFEERQATFGEQPFGRDIQQVETAVEEAPFDRRRLGSGERRVEEIGPHAGLAQRRDLVLHEGYQR